MTSAIKIGLSGLLSSSAQLQASASNIANVKTTSKAGNFQDSLQTLTRNQAYNPTKIHNTPLPGGGVQATSVQILPSQLPFYAPSSPDSNEAGIVNVPNVSLAEEIVQMKMATQAYKANATVIATAQEMEETVLKRIK